MRRAPDRQAPSPFPAHRRSTTTTSPAHSLRSAGRSDSPSVNTSSRATRYVDIALAAIDWLVGRETIEVGRVKDRRSTVLRDAPAICRQRRGDRIGHIVKSYSYIAEPYVSRSCISKSYISKSY